MLTAIGILAAAFLFFTAGIFLFKGKGKWLITGYNTASKEERQRYDEKKLCRAAGSVCILCGVMLCILAHLGYRADSGLMDEQDMLLLGLCFAAVILASVIAAIVYMNTKAKK